MVKCAWLEGEPHPARKSLIRLSANAFGKVGQRPTLDARLPAFLAEPVRIQPVQVGFP